MVKFGDFFKTILKGKNIGNKVKNKFFLKKIVQKNEPTQLIEEDNPKDDNLEIKTDQISTTTAIINNDQKKDATMSSDERKDSIWKTEKKGLKLFNKGMFKPKVKVNTNNSQAEETTINDARTKENEIEKKEIVIDKKENEIDKKENDTSMEHDKKEADDEKKKEEEEDIIKIKHEWWVKMKTIIAFFMKFEYRMISYFIQEKAAFLKTDICSLFFIRILVKLAFTAVLAP